MLHNDPLGRHLQYTPHIASLDHLTENVGICVSYTSFLKSNISWPQQPQTEKVLKFKTVFCDSTPNFIFSKHQNKAEIQNLDDTEVLINDFPDIRTSAASTTSSASAASMASTTSEALFYQKTS